MDMKNGMTALTDDALDQVAGGANGEEGSQAQYIAGNCCPVCGLDWSSRADGPFPRGVVIMAPNSRGGTGVQFLCCGARRAFATENFRWL